MRNAPVKGTEFVSLTLDGIVPSPTNPRKIFDKDELDELTASIRQRGVIVPLTVRRQASGKYEIVAGERRFRASAMAGLTSVPCIIREMTDDEVAVDQLVENMFRPDLTPLEEANGYKLLHGKHGYDYDELATKVGKSKAHIYTRLRLLKLAPAVQKQLASGALSASYAEQLTKVDSHADQIELATRCVRGNFDDLAELRRTIEDEYMLELKRAPWGLGDEGVCPPAPACSACPKRTGAQAELFDGDGKRDFCLEASCWKEKVKAHSAALVAKAKAGKQEVVTGPKAKAMLDDSRLYNAKLVDLDGPTPQWYSRPDSLSHNLKGKEFKFTLVVDDKARAHRLATRADIERLLPKETRSQGQEKPTLTPAQKKEREDKKIAVKAEALAAAEAIGQIGEAFKGKKVEGKLLAAIALVLFEARSFEHQLAAQKRLGIVEQDQTAVEISGFHDWMLKANDAKVTHALVELALGTGLEFGSFDEELQIMAAAAGIKLDKLLAAEIKKLSAPKADKDNCPKCGNAYTNRMGGCDACAGKKTTSKKKAGKSKGTKK